MAKKIKELVHVLFSDERVTVWETAIVSGIKATRSLLRFIQGLEKKKGLSSAMYYRAEMVKAGQWHMKNDSVSPMRIADAYKVASGKLQTSKALSRADKKAIVANRLASMESTDNSKKKNPGKKKKNPGNLPDVEQYQKVLEVVVCSLDDLFNGFDSMKKKKIKATIQAIKESCTV